MASRKRAFATIRQEIGEEICPSVYEVKEAINWSMKRLNAEERPELRAVRDKLFVAQTTTHQLRGALAGLLMLHTDPTLTKCPNCERRLPEHNDLCMVNRLILGVQNNR